MKKIFQTTYKWEFLDAEGKRSVIDTFLTCASNNLLFIPPKNAMAIEWGFFCFDNYLFSLDSCPLIMKYVYPLIGRR